MPSSSRKRKRAVEDEGSDAGRSSSPASSTSDFNDNITKAQVSDAGRSYYQASSTSDFNNNTKAQVREQCNNKCWHCGASPAVVCHVIGSRDDTFYDALRDGLIDFQEIQSPQNAIALCGNCHANFDYVHNPSFFFLPTDLNYFLNYERQDRKRRRRLGRRTGTMPGRRCPTAQTYQDHQRHQGVEGAELGGLYTRIVIRDFLSEYPGRAPFQPGLSEYGATKPWTGSPMASLQRAVLMLRKLNLYGIPLEIQEGLRQLQDAYSAELDLDGSDTSSQGSIEPGEAEETNFEEGREGKYKDKRREPRAKSQQSGAEERHASGNREQDDESWAEERPASGNREQDDESKAEERPASGNREQDDEEYIANKDKRHTRTSDHSEDNLEELSHHDIDSVSEPGNSPSLPWRWGPGVTSEDAAKFFRRVM